MTDALTYLTPEARARVRIDEMLVAAGWAVQDVQAVNLGAGRGVAVREFILKPPHGRVDYLLFVDAEAVGVIEAKKDGTTLSGVEWQTAKYGEHPRRRPGYLVRWSAPVRVRVDGRRDVLHLPPRPEPTSRRVFWFHRPETLPWVDDTRRGGGTPAARISETSASSTSTSLLARPGEAIRNLEVSLGARDRVR